MRKQFFYVRNAPLLIREDLRFVFFQFIKNNFIGCHFWVMAHANLFPLVTSLALLKAQICMISFQTCTQIFGIHKALIHVKR